MTDLRKAAEAVLERWDSPAWEWKKQGPTADLMANLRTALAAEQPKHPGYVIGSHWLETAYSRICAGEAEADVLRDIGLVRITDGTVETADIHAIVDRQEALRRDAERYRWLRDKAPPDIGDMASVRDSHDPSEIDAAIDAAMKEAALRREEVKP